MANYYEILGIPVSATAAEIRQAFRERAEVLHQSASGDKSDRSTMDSNQPPPRERAQEVRHGFAAPSGNGKTPAQPGADVHAGRGKTRTAGEHGARGSNTASPATDTHATMEQLSEALRVLSDPMRRRTYDSVVLPDGHSASPPSRRQRPNLSRERGTGAKPSSVQSSSAKASAVKESSTKSPSATASNGQLQTPASRASADARLSAASSAASAPQFLGTGSPRMSTDLFHPQPTRHPADFAPSTYDRMHWDTPQRDGKTQEQWTLERKEALRASCAFCGSTPTIEGTFSMISNPFAWWRIYIFTVGIVIIPLLLALDPQMGPYRLYLIALPFVAAWPVQRSRTVRVCRTCGLSTFRKFTNRTLVTGWWGVVPAFVNLSMVAQNLLSLRQLKSLDPPRPNVDFMSSHLSPLSPGKPLLQRIGPWVSLVIFAAIAIGAYFLATTSLSGAP